MHRAVTALLGLLLFIQCKPPVNRAVTPIDTAYTLTNGREYPLHVDLYGTKDDRINQVNKIYSCIVPANGSYRIPLSKLNDTTWYQYDIYSDDYRHANWPSDYGTILYGHGSSRFDLANYNLTGARFYFLRGENEKVTWKAVDHMSQDNISDWSSLSDSGKLMEMVVYRKEMVTLHYYAPWLHSWADDTGYITSTSDAEFCTTMALRATTHVSYFFLYSTATSATNDGTARNSPDTCQLDYAGSFWTMKRQ